jgi:hypothetical protein
MAATVQGLFVAADTTPETRAVYFVRVPTPAGEEATENMVTDFEVARWPSSIGLVSLTLLPGTYRGFIGSTTAGNSYFSFDLDQTTGTLNFIDLLTNGSTVPSGLIGYFATLTAAKAYVRFVDARMYAIASSATFPGGTFHYDSDSAATADNVDTIALDSVAGRLLRFI